MTILFKLHLSRHTSGMVAGPVAGVPSATGIGCHGLVPSPVAVRECLPHYYRKSFDRACHSFYFDKYDDMKPAYVTLYNSRGKYLNTLYAIPYEFG